MDIADLPAGATWSGSALLWSPAVAGTYTPTIEVRDAEGTLVASQTIDLTVHPQLTASIPQTAYEAMVGEPLVITPSVANLIVDGAVQWGGNLPGWLDLDEADGTVTVDTSIGRSADNLILTAVDQTDLKDASIEPFSVAVSNDFVVHVTSDVPNVTVSSLFGSAWTQNRPKRLVVADGVSIYSTSSSTAAMTTGANLVNTLTIENHGGIYGGGGTADGGVGGDALVLSTQNVVVNNLGQIWAGGGGGGKGGSGGTGLPTNFSREPASGDTFVLAGITRPR